jgi:hypothetical protein
MTSNSRGDMAILAGKSSVTINESDRSSHSALRAVCGGNEIPASDFFADDGEPSRQRVHRVVGRNQF